jgi:putative NIF3 family GTP cyclohydrolase 1 type 2
MTAGGAYFFSPIEVMMSKSITITAGGLEKVVARLAPPDLADDWDNVGLLVGDASARVRRVLVALEASASVLEEAARRGAQALVVHHPVIFKPVRKVVTTDVVGGLVLKLAAHGIALIAAHTNLDRSPEGTSRALADLVGLAREGERFLVPASQNHGCKFVVFVPEGHVDAVIEAAARAGAGVIGAYSHCTFRSPGVGTYIPLEGARPFAGKVGRLEQAAELRLECLVSRERLGALIEAVRAAHPYEEMAYDVYPLVEGEAQWGLGLIGALERPVTLGALARRVRRKLPALLAFALWAILRAGSNAPR